MQVLAKFKVTSIKETQVVTDYIQGTTNKAELGPCHQVILNAVQGEPFGRYTPQGSIDMMIINPAAAAQFRVGAEYFVTFSADDTDDSADTPEER